MEPERIKGWKSLMKFLSVSQENLLDGFLEKNKVLNYQEILHLHEQFQSLDLNQNNRVELEELQQLEDLQDNPLVSRVFEIFDKDKSGSIDFVEFLTVLSIFSNQGSEEAKLRLLFDIYDYDEDGEICNKDLFSTLLQLTGSHFDQVSLQQIVDKTMISIVADPEGAITFEQFSTFIRQTNGELINKLSKVAL
jgi:serine/threonine-protein phosphatase 2B regulatory subunit